MNFPKNTRNGIFASLIFAKIFENSRSARAITIAKLSQGRKFFAAVSETVVHLSYRHLLGES